MSRPESEAKLSPSNFSRGPNSARRILAYLLRATHVRIDRSVVGDERYRRLSRELADALLGAVTSERSVLGFYRCICTRFGVDPSGGDWGPLEAWLPEGRLRWDRACALIDFLDVRTVVRESPDFLATFACTSEQEEDALFEAFPSPIAPPRYRPRLPEKLISPRGYRATWTLTGPMHHGADVKTGNVNLFRRHTVPDPLTGLTHDVPFVSGNSIRGHLRDRGMGLHLQLLGLKARDILPARAHALLAGGAVEKGADGAEVNNVVRSRARELCPPWDLFAGCIDQQIMQGRGRVSDATLVCQETAWKVHSVIAPDIPCAEFAAQLPSCDEMLEIRQLVRHKHADIEASDGIQMLAQFEVLREGYQMVHAIQLWALDGVEATTASFLAYLLRDFHDLSWVGGGFARDFGSFAFDEYRPGEASDALPSPDLYLEYAEQRKQEMIDWLTLPSAPSGPGSRARGRRSKSEREQQPEAVEAAAE